MKKFSLTVTLIAVLFLTGMQANAQVNNNITGVWTGNDNMSNVVEIKFNSNNTCVFKINGIPAYNINRYYIIYEDPITGEMFDALNPLIYFNAPATATSNPNQITFNTDASPTDRSLTSYRCTGVFNSTFDELIISAKVQVFNTGNDDSGYIINLTK